MDKKPGIVKALMTELGLKSLQLPSKDRSFTALNEKQVSFPGTPTAPIVTPDQPFGESSPSAGVTSPLAGEGTETETESEEEDGFPTVPDAQGGNMVFSRWKMDVKFHLNKNNVQPERGGGGETIRHSTSDNGTVLIWKEDAKKKRNRNKRPSSAPRVRDSFSDDEENYLDTELASCIGSSHRSRPKGGTESK